MAAPLQTVATPAFLNMNMNMVFNPNFDKAVAILRSLKVFIMSYAGYETLSPQLFQQKFIEYFREIQSIYNVQVPPHANFQWFQAAQQMAQMETIQITVGVIRFRGRDRSTNPRFFVNNGIALSPEKRLNIRREVQRLHVFSRATDFNNFTQLRVQNTGITIRLEADNWVQNEDALREFQISYQQINVEGFEDWFDFGRGIELLIKIQFTVVNEPNVNYEDVANYHFHTIFYMVSKTLDHYRTYNQSQRTRHRMAANRSKLSYIRKRINPNSEQAFWSTPNTFSDIMANIQRSNLDVQTVAQSLRKSYNFNDLQIGCNFYDEFEDTFCLCSEWCNWNAFFHFNPIIRFLLVQHNQLYLQNKTNIPDMYLFVVTGNLEEAAVDPNNILEAPVMQLIGCSMEYKNRYNDTFFLKIPAIRQSFADSRPEIGILNGLTYNSLRYHPDLPQMCIQSDANPFADVCTENLTIYYRVLSSIHQMLAYPPYIPAGAVARKKWIKEMDKISRNEYKNYIKLSYDVKLDENVYNYDYLFTEDFEFSKILPKTKGAKEIKRISDNVLKMNTRDNPFNLRFIINEFLDTFVSVYKFIEKVEPMIPIARQRESLRHTMECCQEMDTDFLDYINHPNRPKALKFWITEDIADRGLAGIRKEFNVFYTLKLYFIGFGIQSYFINSMIKYFHRNNYNREQIFIEFSLIWKTNSIEKMFSDKYPNESLFQISNRFQPLVQEFYANYWGLADHEVNQQLPDLIQYIRSGYKEYQRLYFWWKNDGNNKLKFRRIFDSFYNNFEDNISRSEGILFTHILPSIQLLSQNSDFFLEVYDYLVYYLVKANCYIILSSVAEFLTNFYDLIIWGLVQTNLCFILSKPGWVQIFRSMRTAMDFVDRLKALYIVFDNEINRIAKTLLQTKRMIKEIYRNFYKKIVNEWMVEIEYIYERVVPDPTPLFIQLHFAVGLSFIASFIDEFRFQSLGYRKWCRDLLQSPPHPAVPHQALLNACLPIGYMFVSDQNAIRYAQPLCTTHWQIHLYQTFRLFDRNTAADVAIDLALADT